MVVQQKNPERLRALMAEPSSNEAMDPLRICADLSGAERLFDSSAGELGEGDELPGSGGADSSDGAELHFAGTHQSGQSTEGFEHVTGDLEGARSGGSPTSQEKGEKGEIVEALRSSEIPL